MWISCIVQLARDDTTIAIGPLDAGISVTCDGFFPRAAVSTDATTMDNQRKCSPLTFVLNLFWRTYNNTNTLINDMDSRVLTMTVRTTSKHAKRCRWWPRRLFSNSNNHTHAMSRQTRTVDTPNTLGRNGIFSPQRIIVFGKHFLFMPPSAMLFEANLFDIECVIHRQIWCTKF